MALDDRFWDGEREALVRVLLPHITQAALDGGEGAARALVELGGMGVDWGLVNQDVQRWARAHAAETARGITETTRRFLQDAMADWIESGQPLDAFLDAVRPTLGSFRTQMIAVTEVTRAFAEGNRAAWRASGVVTELRWRTAQDERVCPVCGPLEGRTVGIDERFDASLRATHPDALEGIKPFEIPPAHARCRCYLQPVVREP